MASASVSALDIHPFKLRPGRSDKADGSLIERIAAELRQIVDCRRSGRGATVIRYHGEEYQFLNRREAGYLARLLRTRTSVVMAACVWLACQHTCAVKMIGEEEPEN
ncbi:hypothetical protein ENKOMM257B_06925 [Enterobacter kobei]